MRILYIDCDSLRPDHLGCHGYGRNTSPNIDRVAQRGVRFNSCYTSDAPCVPSRTALVSGRFGARTGVVGHSGSARHMRYPGDGHVTDPARMHLPMVLSRNGVHTASLSTFADRHLAWHFCAGWDEIRKVSNKGGNEIATEVEAPAIDWLRVNAGREDWFCHVNFWDPHTPYRTPRDYGNPFADDPPPTFPSAELLSEQWESYGPSSARDAPTFMTRPNMWPGPETIRTPEDLKAWVDGYDTGIRYMDDSIGRMLDVLADQGVLDDCAIIISADHGENQGELNLYGSHLTADAITCRIPMIVSWPGLDRDTRRDEPIYHLDLPATICDLLDIEAPSAWDGRTFAPALRGEAIETRPYLVCGMGAWTVQRAVVADDHIYIRTMHPGLGPMDDELLFDLRNDPHEERNLAGSDAGTCARMARMLTEWWHEVVPETGEDPLLKICREGGSVYVRGAFTPYLKHLHETGREWAVEELERRHIAPIIDPYDFSRF